MKKNFAGLLVVMTMMLCGCGGGSSGTAANTSVQKASVTGTVSFPVISAIVAKQVAAAVPPVLTITDLSGAIVATPALTVDPLDPKKYTYAISLDANKNYILKAAWGGQVLRGLADQSTLNSSTTVVNITPVSTAAVLVAEKELSLTAGQLGTAAAGSVTPAQFAALNPAALLAVIEDGKATTYATLVTEVTTALTNLQDPVAVPAVTTAVSTAPTYVAPLSFTSAMISGKSFNYSDSSGDSGILTFNANGVFTTPDSTGTWSINAPGQLVVVEVGETSTVTLTGNTGSVITVSIASSISGTRTATLTVVNPAAGFTTAMLSGKSFNYQDTDPNANNGQGDSGVLTFDANGDYSADGTKVGTWSINSLGQLVMTQTGSVQTATLTSNTGTVISSTDRYVTPAGTRTFTSTLTVVPTTTVPTTTSLIGTWGVYSLDATIISFVDSTHYMLASGGTADAGGQPGLEYGTYTYDPATGVGAFNKTPLFDTNGDWGASHPPVGTSYSIQVSGDTLTVGNTVEGNRQVPRLKSSTTNPVVGSWWAPFTDAATGKAGGVLMAFLDDTHCILAQAGNDAIDNTGQSGIELGTYTISPSNVFSTSLVVDTNGEWGFSTPQATPSISVSGNALTISNSVEGSFVINRLQ